MLQANNIIESDEIECSRSVCISITLNITG